MDINRLTEKAQEALRAAQSEATRLGHQQIDVEHPARAGALPASHGADRCLKLERECKHRSWLILDRAHGRDSSRLVDSGLSE